MPTEIFTCSRCLGKLEIVRFDKNSDGSLKSICRDCRKGYAPIGICNICKKSFRKEKYNKKICKICIGNAMGNGSRAHYRDVIKKAIRDGTLNNKQCFSCGRVLEKINFGINKLGNHRSECTTCYSRRTRIAICDVCGSDFIPNNHKSRSTCNSCKRIINIKNKTCKYCENDFKRLGNYKFCSNGCKRNYGLEQKREYIRRERYDALVVYSDDPPCCMCCGEDRILFLAFDHINGGGLKHYREIRNKYSTIVSWMKANSYPPGFQVLCHNCNNDKRAGEKCSGRDNICMQKKTYKQNKKHIQKYPIIYEV